VLLLLLLLPMQVMQDTWCELQHLYPHQLAAAQEAAADGSGLFAADAAIAAAAGAAARQQAQQDVQQVAPRDEQYWQQLLLDR
jgi:hypothetical protein